MDINIKNEIKVKLESTLGRRALPHEIINAETDIGILVPIILKRLLELEEKVDKISK